MERKLASIQRVLAIEPIVNADAIELARINGWQCVVKKGEFAPGNLGVFLEIDSVPPDSEVFRFLWQPKSERRRRICRTPGEVSHSHHETARRVVAGLFAAAFGVCN